MNKKEFKNIIDSINLYNSKDYNKLISSMKHNICQNMRIARNLSNIKLETAAQYFNLEPQSLRRIEAENDRDSFSIQVFIIAVMLYNQDANFYFEDWEINETLLEKKYSLDEKKSPC